MKTKKGFTLIELLAVIVILAIIALIATPIILNIISDAKEESNERSVELYGKAVEQAIAKTQLNGTEVQAGDLSSDFLTTVQYSGSEVECTINKLYEDGSVYLEGCRVGTDTKEYTYGTSQYQQVYKPDFYGDWAFSGTVNETVVESPSENPPDKSHYLGYDLDSDKKVSAAYVCFKRNGNEYCLKGYDRYVYTTNQEILADAFADVADACSFGDGSSSCSADLSAIAKSYGNVVASGDTESCSVSVNGAFGCRER